MALIIRRDKLLIADLFGLGGLGSMYILREKVVVYILEIATVGV